MGFFISLIKRYFSIFAFLLLWEAGSRLGWLDSQFIPPFSRVAAFIWDSLLTGNLLEHLLISLGRAAGGFAVALVVSIPLGVALAGWSENIRIAAEPLAEWFSHINPFVLFHVIALFMGSGETIKVTIIAWACIWPIVFSTLSGVLHADPHIVKEARSFGLSRFQLTVKVLLPAAVPSIFTGMRLAAGYSLLLLIAAEMMGASSGLGWLISKAEHSYQIVEMFSAVTVIAVLAVLVDGVVSFWSKRFSYHLQ